ncbi:MAG: hypothetical protein LUC93_17650 [Planctomycetaceae bacterium]|nr:hypothetical protein [Planctomycetaceae bacterium]
MITSPDSVAIMEERTATIIRSIASGNNQCGTLFCNGQLNEPFLAASIKPTLAVYQDEADRLREDVLSHSQESENRRQALELVYSNALDALPPEIADRVSTVLGRRR